MPIPVFLLAGLFTASSGVGLSIHGGYKIKKAKAKISEAQKRNTQNYNRLERFNIKACQTMDNLGLNEMSIITRFNGFSNLFEKIKNRPVFNKIKREGIVDIAFHPKELENISVSAGILVGGLGSATLGTAAGFAASGATNAAIVVLRTTSTGASISSLSGAALTEATLAVLEEGTIAVGSSGITLGTTFLGATSLGVGVLIGGIVFNISGSIISGKADKIWALMLDNEKKINKICLYLSELNKAAIEYNCALNKIDDLYLKEVKKMKDIVNSHLKNGHADWNSFNQREKTIVGNTILLVGLLYQMCKVNIVNKAQKNELNTINYKGINESIQHSEKIYSDLKDFV